MAKRDDVVNYLDGYLKNSEIPDMAVNGLQVEGNDTVKKVAFAVDACMNVFEKAAAMKADMIIVHHGLFWKDTDLRIDGLVKKRLSILLKEDISLYSSHLPLDRHPDIGNNAIMAKRLFLKNLLPFANYHGVECGWYGKTDKEYELDDFLRLIEKKIGKITTKLIFGRKLVRTAGIVSGGGSFAVNEMDKYGIDILISGETEHQIYSKTKEYGVNVAYLGHYFSETFGVKALGEKLKEKFRDIDIFFIDSPTGL